jgi:hypothetical protein
MPARLRNDKAVVPPKERAALSPKLRFEGLRAIAASSRNAMYSAWPPPRASVKAKTRSHLLKARHLTAYGLDLSSQLRAENRLPPPEHAQATRALMPKPVGTLSDLMRQSPEVTVVAWIRTRISSDGGAGVSRTRTSSTSGGPYAVATIALMASPAA